MKVWASLYLVIWLALIEFLSVLTKFFGLPFSLEIHIFLGTIILVLTYNNLVKVKKTDAPERIKRILKTVVGFVSFQAILGVLLFINLRYFSIPFMDISDFIHLVISLAVIAQASSAATGYDMWEEKEFT